MLWGLYPTEWTYVHTCVFLCTHACHVHEVWQSCARKVCGEKLLQLRVLVWRQNIKRGWVQTVLHKGERRGTTRGEGPGPTRALLFEVDAQGWVETPLMTPPIPRPSTPPSLPGARKR